MFRKPERKKYKYTGIEFGGIRGNPALVAIMKLSNCKQILNKELLLRLQISFSFVEIITFPGRGPNIKSSRNYYIFQNIYIYDLSC